MGIKNALKNIGKTVAGQLTGGMSDVIFDAIEGKVEGTDAAKQIAELRQDPAVRAELARIEADRDTAVAEAAANIIVAEAKSDNLLAKTARPGAIWAVTIMILLNYLIPMATQAWEFVVRVYYPHVPLAEVPVIKPQEIPMALFGVWATALGGYIWSRRLEKRDRERADIGTQP